MRVGLSLSRCVREIYEGKVNIYDVLVVIARTDFDPEDDNHWKGIWNGYGGGGTLGNPFSNPEWNSIPAEDEQKVRDICIELKHAGKLHQPRKFGAHPARLPYIWLDTFAPEEEIANNPATVKAWEKYKLLAGLS
jgi:hypothetical protein